MVSLVRTREVFEQEEGERLASFAMRSAASRGRLYPEPPHAYRTDFQRDRDRVVHSRAFRRLEYKTQVFVPHEGDHYRNRLTHTLEAGQITRTIARVLRLNEELAEAIVLAHDLGHTPFGHAGERVLAELMKTDGGFDHNRQSLRIVDWLEDRYPGFRGLNLSYETREGILKHGCHWDHPVTVPDPTAQPCLEAQVADLADEIAYTNHDLDDGLRSELIDMEQLEEISLWSETRAGVQERVGDVAPRVLRAQIIVALINRLVTDLIESSAARLAEARVESPDAVRGTVRRMIRFSSDLEPRKRELKRFLHRELYHHPQVLKISDNAEQVVGDLFRAYRRDTSLLPDHVRERFREDGEARAISDYVAGMTDRFAIEEHDKRFGTPA